MRLIYRYIGFVFALGVLFSMTSCEDVINVQPDDADTFIVVDAWLDNTSFKQTIRLTNSQPYFNNSFSPAITGAEVTVIKNGTEELNFTDQGDGNYFWFPGDDSIGEVNDTYELRINIDGETYTASSVMNRVPTIDSISQELLQDDLQGPDGLYAEFFSRDFVGIGDAYWIKTYKNGAFLNKPEEINLAYDAGFDTGQDIDGLIFIPPVRSLVNPVPDTLTSEVPYWDPGDEIRVEIYSITEEAFIFMERARNQMINGNQGIFTTPIANSPGNIEGAAGGKEVLGMFCVSAVESRSKVFE